MKTMFVPRNSLSKKVRQQVVAILNQVLADLTDKDKSLWFLEAHLRR